MGPIAVAFKIVLLLGVIIVLMQFLFYWINNLVKLMIMRRDEFPDKYDKIIWIFIIVFLGVIGAFAFAKWYKQWDSIKQLKKK